MKIAIAQCHFSVGDIAGNTNRIIAEYQQTDAELIIFSELALCGYPPEDLLFRPDFLKQCKIALQKILRETREKALIVGYPERINGKIYNKAAMIQNGKMIADYAKQELPNDTVFDEKRYFTAGNQPCVFELNHIRFGVVICEDVWQVGPILQAKNAGAECIISINASPYDQNQIRARDSILKKRTDENHIPIIYVNNVGGQDELVFDGGSMIVDENGDCCAHATHHQEMILIADIAKHNGKIIISSSSLPKPLSLEQAIYDTLTLGVRDYMRKNQMKNAWIGLSGGIDSALTLAIAVDAMSADNITAIIMPSQFSAKMSIEDAIAQANALNVKYHIIQIDALLQAFLTTLSPIFQNIPADTTEENLQARIRGMLLMALSNKYGGIVLTTGNKSEMAVGYATLYGDMAGGFAVIKNVYKTMVYQLAKYRNNINPVIPDRVITRAPTAELKPNQTDQDKLPPYDMLDQILERYIEKEEDAETIIAAGFEKKIVHDVIRMINQNEYKRRQAPIGVRISKHAFGKDRRYPIIR